MRHEIGASNARRCRGASSREKRETQPRIGHESSLIFTEAKEPESWRAESSKLADAPANEDETLRALSSSELLIMLEMGHEHF
jgi:hypothetical protein